MRSQGRSSAGRAHRTPAGGTRLWQWLRPIALGLPAAGAPWFGRFAFAGAVLLIMALFPNKYYLTIAVFAGLNSLLTIGLNLLLGFGGQVSLGHAAFYGIGAYGTGIMAVRLGWPAWACLPMALILTAAVAYAIGTPTLKLKGHYLALATLGFGLIVQILLVELPGLTGGPAGLIGIPVLALGPLAIKGDRSFALLIWGLIFFCQWALASLRQSRSGRALLAINANEDAAASLGVDTSREKRSVFAASAVLAALAGGLYAYYINFISPDSFGFGYSVQILTMAVVGGLGTVWGPVLGALALTVLPEAFRLADDYETIIYGLVLILTIAFLPNGLLDGGKKLAQRAGRWRHGNRSAAS